MYEYKVTLFRNIYEQYGSVLNFLSVSSSLSISWINFIYIYIYIYIKRVSSKYDFTVMFSCSTWVAICLFFHPPYQNSSGHDDLKWYMMNHFIRHLAISSWILLFSNNLLITSHTIIGWKLCFIARNSLAAYIWVFPFLLIFIFHLIIAGPIVPTSTFFDDNVLTSSPPF